MLEKYCAEMQLKFEQSFLFLFQYFILKLTDERVCLWLHKRYK